MNPIQSMKQRCGFNFLGGAIVYEMLFEEGCVDLLKICRFSPKYDLYVQFNPNTQDATQITVLLQLIFHVSS